MLGLDRVQFVEQFVVFVVVDDGVVEYVVVVFVVCELGAQFGGMLDRVHVFLSSCVRSYACSFFILCLVVRLKCSGVMVMRLVEMVVRLVFVLLLWIGELL